MHNGLETQESLIKNFIALRDGVIRSTLGRQLTRQGHGYNIDEGVQLSRPVSMRPPYAELTLEVFPSDDDWKSIERLRPFNRIPSITFGLDLSQRRLDVFVHPNCESGRQIRPATIAKRQA